MARQWDPDKEEGGGVDGSEPPVGIYPFKIEAFKRNEAQGGGSFYLGIKYRVVAGAHEDCVWWDNLSLSPKALWKLKNLLLSIGYSDGGFDLDSDTAFAKVLKGPSRIGKCKLAEEEYDGKTKVVIDRFYSLTADERTAIIAAMGSSNGGSRPSGPSGDPRGDDPGFGAPPPPSDDIDIPF